MFFYLLYWLISPILWILLIPACLFNAKICHHWSNEKKSWLSAQTKCHKYRNKKTVVLFHAASAGEFEQLKPVLEKMDRNQYFILLTFFSPTAYKYEKNTPMADAVCYHPFDFIWSAW